jgi:hypothetical protein
VPRSIARRRFRAFALLIACGFAGLMSGCSAGRVSQTAEMVPAVPGYNADSPDGSVSLRDVLVVYKTGGYPKGGLAPLSLHIFNNRNDQTITLKGVTSPDGTVCLAGGGAVPTGTAPTPPVAPGATATPSPSAGNTSSPTPSGSPTASPTALPTPSPAGPGALPAGACTEQVSVAVPPIGFATLSPDAGPYLAVRLKEDLPPAGVVTLTFTFDNNPDRTIDGVKATMAPPPSPLPRSPLPLEPHE